MSSTPNADVLLVRRIRAGESDAWSELIGRFEGRLLAFVEGRIGRRSAGEDVVQETFLGFLNSLPNYDESRPLESYLFTIAAHKLTDYLRREGRRPTLPLSAGNSSEEWDVPGRGRAVSSLMQSGQRRKHEETSLVAALGAQIERWKATGQWQKLACLELVFVRGLPNKEIASQLKISEQAVANYKSDFLIRIRKVVSSE